jgi:hypothetical protein
MPGSIVGALPFAYVAHPVIGSAAAIVSAMTTDEINFIYLTILQTDLVKHANLYDAITDRKSKSLHHVGVNHWILAA